jgi:16S rRNA G1207 methylase RsmC
MALFCFTAVPEQDECIKSVYFRSNNTRRNDMTFDSTTLFSREYQLGTMMGPNCLRILDELLARRILPAKARVLDLGCGMGLTSMALAKGYGCTVTAADLWIPGRGQRPALRRGRPLGPSRPCTARPTPCPSSRSPSTP